MMKQKILIYRNLFSSDLADLERQVTDKISEGWQPIGPIVHFKGTMRHPVVGELSCDYFAQQIVKTEEEA